MLAALLVQPLVMFACPTCFSFVFESRFLFGCFMFVSA